MTFERDFLELLPHTVTLTQRSTQNVYGEATYGGAATTHRARVLHKREMLRTKNGEEEVSDTVVWLAGNSTFPDVGPEDRITLPDGSTRPILIVERYADDDGNHHVKVYCGEQ